MEKESLQRMASIEDEMHLARQKSHSDAEFCALLKLRIPTKEIAQYRFIAPKTVQNKDISSGKSLPSQKRWIPINGLRIFN